MKRFTYEKIIFFIFLFSLFTSCSLVSREDREKIPVILISLDGFEKEAFNKVKDKIKNNLNSFNVLELESKSVRPSTTVVNHSSMLTGQTPEQHGIFFESHNDNLKLKTVFNLVRDSQMISLAIVSKQKLEFLIKESNQYFVNESDSLAVMNLFEKKFFELNPHFSFLHIRDIDYSGHVYGWNSKEYKEKVDEVVINLNSLLKKITNFKRNVTIIITTDHGGNSLGHNYLNSEEIKIPWISFSSIKRIELTDIKKINIYDNCFIVKRLLGID